MSYVTDIRVYVSVNFNTIYTLFFQYNTITIT